MSRIGDLGRAGPEEKQRPKDGIRTPESIVCDISVGNQKRCHGHGNKKQGGRVKISSFTIECMAELTIGVCEDPGWSLEISSQGRLGALYSSLAALTALFSSPEEAAFGFTIFLRSLSSSATLAARLVMSAISSLLGLMSPRLACN